MRQLAGAHLISHFEQASLASSGVACLASLALPNVASLQEVHSTGIVTISELDSEHRGASAAFSDDLLAWICYRWQGNRASAISYNRELRTRRCLHLGMRNKQAIFMP